MAASRRSSRGGARGLAGLGAPKARRRGLSRVGWMVVLLLAVAAAVTAGALVLGRWRVRWLFQAPGERARILWKMRRYDEAIKQFEVALGDDPTDAVALRGMARCFKGKGNLRMAAAWADRAAKHDTSAQAHVLRAELALQMAGVWERAPAPQKKLTDRERFHLSKAVECAKAALAVESAHGPAYRALGEATARLGDMQEAVVLLRRAIEVDPQSRLTRLYAAELLVRQNRLAEALQHVRYTLDELAPRYLPALRLGTEIYLQLGQFEQAIALCERMAAAGEDRALVHLHLATCYLGKGDFERAVAEGDKAELYFGTRVIAPLLHWVRGTALMELRRFDRAVVDYRLLASREDGARANYRLGQAHAGGGQKALARDAFLKAIQLDPRLFGAHQELAALLVDDGRVGQALAQLRKGLDVLQEGSEAHRRACYAMVRFCMDRGLHDEAEEEVHRLLRLDPRSPELSALLATLHLDRGDPEQALPIARHALRLRPRDVRLIQLVARAEAANGNHEVAAARFAQAVRIDPTFRAPYLSWASMRFEEGKLAAAEDVYERARKALNDPADVRVALAKFHLATGRHDEGVKELRRVVDRDPRDVTARVALVEHFLARGDTKAALHEAQAAVHALPNSVAAHSLLARVHRARGEWHDFRRILNHVAEQLDPNAFIAYQRLAALVHERLDDAAAAVGDDALTRHPAHRRMISLDVAVARFLGGKHQDAIDAMRLAISQDPRDCDAGLVLSLMELVATRKAPTAPACRQDALPPGALEGWADLAAFSRKSPDEARRVALALLEAFIYENAGWHDMATRQCAGILEIAPKNLIGHALVPVLLERDGKRAKAVAAAERSVAANPDFAYGRELLADLLLLQGTGERSAGLYAGSREGRVPPSDLLTKGALLATARGQHAEAVSQWQAILRYNPHDLQAHNNLAWLLATQREGDLDAALRHAAAALKLDREHPAVLDTAGWVHYHASRNAKAIELLEAAVARAPFRALYHFHLGMAYARERKTAHAQRALRQAVSLDPDAPFVDQAQQTLTNLRS